MRKENSKDSLKSFGTSQKDKSLLKNSNQRPNHTISTKIIRAQSGIAIVSKHSTNSVALFHNEDQKKTIGNPSS